MVTNSRCEPVLTVLMIEIRIEVQVDGLQVRELHISQGMEEVKNIQCTPVGGRRLNKVDRGDEGIAWRPTPFYVPRPNDDGEGFEVRIY